MTNYSRALEVSVLQEALPKIRYIDYPGQSPEKIDLLVEIHVWRYRHSESNDVLSGSGVLTEGEVRKAKSFYFPRDQIRFLEDRRNLKMILSYYIDCDPPDIEVSYTESGKPFLRNIDVEFNVSHSGDLSVYAFWCGGKIGVDIECIREMANIDEIMRHFYTHEERLRVNRETGYDRIREFFAVWTEKEALVKMLGTGISDIKNGKDTKYIIREIVPENNFIGALAFTRSRK